MIIKVYELACDNPNCGNAMNHLYGDNIAHIKRQAVECGHIIVGNKCYCDQECYDESKIPEKEKLIV